MDALLVVVIAVGSGCTACGRACFDPCGSDPRLASLQLVTGTQVLTNPFAPAFDPDIASYAVDVGLAVQGVQLSAVPLDPTTRVDVIGAGADHDVPLALGANTITVVATACQGAATAYDLTVARAGTIVDGSYVKASNTDPFDYFGSSVAIDGDTLAVGAVGESSDASGVDGNQADNSLGQPGAVYVFTRTAGVWMQQAYIKASNPETAAMFGKQVSLSGDTLAVSATGESGSSIGIDGDQTNVFSPGAGAVYVFVRTGTTWAQQAYVKASNTMPGQYFGAALAIADDTLVVGAPGEASAATGVNGNQTDQSAPAAGAVYVFTRSDETWAQQAYLKASNAAGSGYFGGAVAISDATIVVGAAGDASAAIGIGGNQADRSAAGAGAAYVFTRSGTTWTQQAYLKASNTGAGDGFGSAVACSLDTIAVGAPDEASAAIGIDGDQDDDSAPASGATYVFTRTGTTWTQQAYVKASNTAAGDLFGCGVAVAGDALVAGARGHSASAGAAYLFARVGATWAQDAFLQASNAEAGAQFGAALSLYGDTLVVGAAFESSDATGVDGDEGDHSASNAGAVYVFE